MSDSDHLFPSFILDPVPTSLWRQATTIEGTRLGFCENCGFLHVDPYPPAEYLARYYSGYEMPTPQANLAETARLLARNLDPAATVIDMGCGDGSFLQEMFALGFHSLVGFDQSQGWAVQLSAVSGDSSRQASGNFWRKPKDGHIAGDAVVMVNVLEHVAEPLDLLRRIRRLLSSQGKLCVTVPNDFSPLQKGLSQVRGICHGLFVCRDHLNYFDFKTLENALTKTGFRVTDQSALYPLELFLLQDLDYMRIRNSGRWHTNGG
ncbi:MAG: class I SAM-dependent methyltransferase [Verrucomicrobia bacterium]|nr:class I SAM-dependent methyltransferase [Verrucomicrobiota bacterium]